MAESHSIDTLSDEQFGWYLTGFTDGEGCFRLGLITCRTRMPKYEYVTAEFFIKLRDDDAAILEAIRRRLGCGKIERCRSYGATANGNPQAKWRVCRIFEVADIIVPHFARFPLQAKKAGDFTIWKQAVMLRRSISVREQLNKSSGRFGIRGKPRITTDDEHAQLLSFTHQLKQGRLYQRPPK